MICDRSQLCTPGTFVLCQEIEVLHFETCKVVFVVFAGSTHEDPRRLVMGLYGQFGLLTTLVFWGTSGSFKWCSPKDHAVVSKTVLEMGPSWTEVFSSDWQDKSTWNNFILIILVQINSYFHRAVLDCEVLLNSEAVLGIESRSKAILVDYTWLCGKLYRTIVSSFSGCDLCEC